LAEKKGGCFSTGCGILVAAFVLFLAIGFISGLFSDGSDTDTAPQTPATTTPAETAPSTPPPAETRTPTTPTEVVTSPPAPAETPVQEPGLQTTGENATVLLETIKKEPPSKEALTRSYSWAYGEWKYSWDLKIPESLYEYYKGLPRPPTKNYSVYVTHPLDDTYLDLLIEKMKAVSSKDGLDERQTVEMVTAFVQSLPYTEDSVTTPYDEYPRYPVETLVDNGGDCEDTSILLASLLKSMGYGVVLLRLPHHVAVGVKGGENVQGTYFPYGSAKYYYIETTGSEWGIGQLPEEYESASASVYPMIPVPIITHEWTIESEGTYGVLEVKVTNLGTATASDMYVYAGFDAGNGKGWSLKESDTFNLEPGHEVTATMYLIPPPPGQHVRLMVWIMMGGSRVDESYSVWIDT
jgi:predicted transglutaminase-like cysteine proteinase